MIGKQKDLTLIRLALFIYIYVQPSTPVKHSVSYDWTDSRPGSCRGLRRLRGWGGVHGAFFQSLDSLVRGHLQQLVGAVAPSSVDRVIRPVLTPVDAEHLLCPTRVKGRVDKSSRFLLLGGGGGHQEIARLDRLSRDYQVNEETEQGGGMQSLFPNSNPTPTPTSPIACMLYPTCSRHRKPCER